MALSLRRQGTTTWYAATANAPAAFLLWDLPVAVPTVIDAAATAGPDPAYAGWHVFGKGPGQWTSGLEAALRNALTPASRAASAFAWFSVSQSGAVRIVGRVLTKKSAGASPMVVVSADVALVDQVEIGAGATAALVTDGGPVRFGFSHPPLPAAPPPGAAAIFVDLEGKLVGTLRFTGLNPVRRTPALKDVVGVSIDPLDLTNADRTYIGPPSGRVRLTEAGGKFRLEAVK